MQLPFNFNYTLIMQSLVKSINDLIKLSINDKMK